MQTLNDLRWVFGLEQVDCEKAVMCGQVQGRRLAGSEEVGDILHLHEWHIGLLESNGCARQCEVSESALDCQLLYHEV